ncbi:hypothetical protein, partial [Rhodoferax sp. U11-2br]|uniref:hypothetical protein n=1 Tax=Rhodoferax sp. U11-2br TaxID=2838878 RepID=UPI001BE6C081
MSIDEAKEKKTSTGQARLGVVCGRWGLTALTRANILWFCQHLLHFSEANDRIERLPRHAVVTKKEVIRRINTGLGNNLPLITPNAT